MTDLAISTLQRGAYWVLSSALLIASGYAQSSTHARPTANHTSGAHSIKMDEPCYLNRAFDPNTLKLPPHFCGADVARLISSVNGSPLLAERSEFETRDAYDARLEQFKTVPLLPGLQASDLIAFVLTQESLSYDAPMAVAYDADREEFTLRLNMNKQVLFRRNESPKMTCLKLRETHSAHKEYVASNAMGVRVNVTEHDTTSVGIAMGYGSSQVYPATVLLADVPAAQAPALKKVLAILVTGHMESPWAATTIIRHDATMDDPTKTSDSQEFLLVVPSEVLVYRTDTGEVLKRLPAR